MDLPLSHWGTSVTYTPKGGSGRTITVILDRNPAVHIPGTASGFSPYVDAWIKNHATEGTTSIVVGGDTLTFAARYGGTAEAYDITEIIEQDAGCWHVRMRVKR